MARTVYLAGPPWLVLDDGNGSIERLPAPGNLPDIWPDGGECWADSAAIRSFVEHAVHAGEYPAVALGRRNHAATILGATWRKWRLKDLALRVPRQLQGPTSGDPAERLPQMLEINAEFEALAEEMGCRPRVSIGSTAMSVLPRQWTRAAAVLNKTEAHAMARHAYYGGRVQCFRPGWAGNATEYDINSAYGWSLSLKLPDYRTYENRRRLPLHSPAWIDCTVQVSGSPGPLPVRDPIDRSLSWPESGRFRGVWTRADLEQAGVFIVEVHKMLVGRWSDDLCKPLEHWTELRETAGPWRRKMIRLAFSSLSGKLAQRPIHWTIWNGNALPPEGSVPLSVNAPLFAIPSVPKYWPPSSPTTASYVTARVRCEVYRYLRDNKDVLYTDTDSCHLPEWCDHPPLGKGAGQWSRKHTGPAYYAGRRKYAVGTKQVNLTLDQVPLEMLERGKSC